MTAIYIIIIFVLIIYYFYELRIRRKHKIPLKTDYYTIYETYCLMGLTTQESLKNCFLLPFSFASLFDRCKLFICTIKDFLSDNQNFRPIYRNFFCLYSYCAVLFEVLLVLLRRAFKKLYELGFTSLTLT